MSEAAPALATYVGLGAALRAAGVAVGSGQQLAFARSVTALDPGDVDDVYWAGRSCLVSRQGDLVTYDRVFAEWLRSAGLLITVAGVPPTGSGTAGAVRVDIADVVRVGGDSDRAGLAASDHEALRHKDFAACSPAERDELGRLLRELTLRTPKRRSRRSQRAPRGHQPDLRRALRDTIRDETRPPRLPRRRPRERRRPLLLVLDVSGSMADYSRTLLQFAWSARRSSASVEVFCFGTRLTRITGALASRDPDAAIDDAARTIVDWDGGTRIGESLHELLRRHSRRAGCRGAVTVICSDGLERGDPDLLAAQLARLRRLSYRVVWVNPLSADPAFAPVSRGMAAALPHVDALLAGHSLASLQELARVVSELA